MLAQLISSVRNAVHDGAFHVAAALQPYLSCPDLLTPAQMEPDPSSYRQHILYVEPDGSFSIVALVWLPGQRTCIHDHVSWCVVGTYLGAEEEIRYRNEGSHLCPEATAVNHAGTATYVEPPGDIHEVRNVSDDKVISIHVYGADVSVLGSSIRRRYDLPVYSVA